MFSNLVSNAHKFADKTVKLSATREMAIWSSPSKTTAPASPPNSGMPR